jgi:hypothetical protein
MESRTRGVSLFAPTKSAQVLNPSPGSVEPFRFSLMGYLSKVAGPFIPLPTLDEIKAGKPLTPWPSYDDIKAGKPLDHEPILPPATPAPSTNPQAPGAAPVAAATQNGPANAPRLPTPHLQPSTQVGNLHPSYVPPATLNLDPKVEHARWLQAQESLRQPAPASLAEQARLQQRATEAENRYGMVQAHQRLQAGEITPEQFKAELQRRYQGAASKGYALPPGHESLSEWERFAPYAGADPNAAPPEVLPTAGRRPMMENTRLFNQQAAEAARPAFGYRAGDRRYGYLKAPHNLAKNVGRALTLGAQLNLLLQSPVGAAVDKRVPTISKN